mmetsp:Transcript_23349/g.44783  ORF Transcript_23349/g.44783 Transcript_23349/m.44783 type:complete len:217 (+) Transcript_23349:851-1501(+)
MTVNAEVAESVAEEPVDATVATGRCGAAVETMRDATSTARGFAPCCTVRPAAGRFGGAAVVAVAAWAGAAMSSLSKSGGCCTAATPETVGPVLCCRMAKPNEIRGGPPAVVAEAAGERVSLQLLLLGTGDHGQATLTEAACSAVGDPADATGSGVPTPPDACDKLFCLGAGGCCCCCCCCCCGCCCHDCCFVVTGALLPALLSQTTCCWMTAPKAC